MADPAFKSRTARERRNGSKVFLLSCWLLAGCAAHRVQLDKALMADRGASERNENVPACYLARHPDILDVQIAGRPGLSGMKAVAADGCVAIGRQQVRVEGQSTPEVARRIASATGVSPSSVSVRLVEYHSQRVYLFGPGIGVQRAVDYQGPETVLDMLKRTGGITPGAAPNEVYVVRPNIVEDKPPGVFQINLHAILAGQDQSTNVRLQPYDQVFIGETRQASLQKCVPPCFRPLYEAVCGLDRQ